MNSSFANLQNTAVPPRGAAQASELVLVVDDTEANQYTMVRILRGAGYEVIPASSGEQALALAREHLPAVVVLDVLLPDIMGWEVCARLKRDPATAIIPVLQVSASYTSDHDRAHGLNEGADGYLVQPIDPTVLVASVRALLRLRATHVALHGSEQRLRALLHSAPVILFAADRNGTFTLFTGSCLETLEPMPGAVVGRSLYSVHAGDRGFLDNATRALQGAAFVDELPLYGRWFEIRYNPLHDAHARPDGFVAVAMDVTERRKAERAREYLLAVVAHDLRSPIAGIRLNIEVLKRLQAADASGAVTAADVLQTMDRSVKRAERLISDLLDHAKMETGMFSINPAPQNLEALLREAHDLMTPIARENDVRLVLETDAAALECDGARLLQAVCNLIENAIKFSPAGGEIRVRASADLAEHLITVEDDGPGIPPAELPYLFDRFWQGRAKRKHGVGLGLAIAHGIVRAHAGRIWAENRVPSGARLCIALPK